MTELVPAVQFYEAEEYHQEYFARQSVSTLLQLCGRPKLAKFRTSFASKLKP